METIYDRIKKRRKELHMSQEKLAQLTGYKDKSSISYIEKGEKDLPQNKISIFAEVLQTSQSYLMDGYDVNVIYHQILGMSKMDQMLLINKLIDMAKQEKML